MEKMKILLDTNFLVYCAKQKIDYLYEIDNLAIEKSAIIVLSSVIDELKRLEEEVKKRSDRDAFSLALSMLQDYIKKGKIKILKTDKKADKAILELSEKDKAKGKIIVATADKELKRALKGRARLLVIRGRKKLELL